MKKTMTLSIGSVALIDKIAAEFDYLGRVLHGISGKMNHFLPCVRLLIHNRLADCVSTNRLRSIYDESLFRELGFFEIPSDRTLYRAIERLGAKYGFVIEQHQRFIREENLTTDTQFMDFSSTYFEGKSSALGEYGYSRDHQPGKKQFTFGISTGLNEVPTALTIQKGNVNDKTHFAHMVRVASAALPFGSLLIYDCGGNTRKNNALVRDKGFHYLTLKQKKVTTYRSLISLARDKPKTVFAMNKTNYECTKITEGDKTTYLFFSEELRTYQLATKARAFERELNRNNALLKRVQAGKPLAEYLTTKGIIVAKGSLQEMLTEIENPHINGLEGYFALESSLNIDSERVLALYKDKDKAEKLMRSIKEGTEIHPVRHWSDDAIIGYVLIIFLTNVMLSLTHLRSKNTLVKNTKLLKKYLSKLTLVIQISQNGRQKRFLANISPEIRAILGDFLQSYQSKCLKAG